MSLAELPDTYIGKRWGEGVKECKGRGVKYYAK